MRSTDVGKPTPHHKDSRTSRGAPTGISSSISFQHPFNRAGGRTFNVRRKIIIMKVTLVAPFLIFICIPYVSSCTLEDERRPLPVGPMFSFGAFFSGERMIPRKDLQVTIIENRHSAVINLNSR